MKKIRVGIIRCDTHGMYYGALMAPHDPLRLREPIRYANARRRDSWQTGGAHYYFYADYADSTRITVPVWHEFEIARVWDEDADVAEMFAMVFAKPPQVCRSYEEVSTDVDLVFIADCKGDGSDHLKLATPGLEKKIPTFIDKPFAYSLKDALAIIRLAQKKRVPVMSLSLLNAVPDATHFRDRLKEIAPVEFGEVKGFGRTLAGQIHTISLAQHVFGGGVTAVEGMGKNQLGHLHLDYGGKPERPAAGVMLNCDSGGSWHCNFYVNAYSQKGAIHSDGIGDFDFPVGAVEILKKAQRMCRTGKAPVPYGEMLECIAIAEAGRLSQKKRHPVRLDAVWPGRSKMKM